jgi:sterol desaturase/sphingolipid hydroxylase (fatty acid hydroxylase superfamily)
MMQFLQQAWAYASLHFMNGLGALYLGAFLLVPLILSDLFFATRKLDWKTFGFNLVYTPVFLAASAMALQPIATALQPHMPENLFGARPGDWSMVTLGIVLLLYVAAFDFFYYWFHRAQHRFPLLWRYHQLHHSDPNVSTLTSFRHHWLEEVFRYFCMAIPLVFLFGHPESAAPKFGLALGLYGLFIHWNMNVRLGWFTRVIVGPQYHRVHHSRSPEHFGKNFAVFFPFWDKLFGTQYLPAAAEFPETGVASARQPHSLRQALPLPPLKI